jgi:FkbH-like protein
VHFAARLTVILEVVKQPSFRFAISASFTAEPIQPSIDFWGRRLNSDFEVRFAPYNQLLQTLLDPSSVFAANQHGVNILLLRLEDLTQFDLADPSVPARIETNANELVHLVRDSASRFNAPVLVCLCPASPAFLADAVHRCCARDLTTRMAGALHDVPGVQFISHGEIERRYPVEDPHDPGAERLGRIPYTETYFCALGTAMVRHAHSLFTPPYKVIALDCDNTLWQGICGEDGPSGVVLDPPRKTLHEFMLEQREAGMLLTLASKNNEQDVFDTFAANPHMPLGMRHFVAWRLNWESKAENLSSLAAELGLGLDSFIFVDDNARECAEVAENVPEVLALTLPDDITRLPHFLNHVWAFDHPVVTEEDRNRNAYYSQSQQFGREIKRAGNLEEFIVGLHLEVSFTPLSEERLSRVAQLTQRTNQFNFTTIRRPESDIRALAAQGYECIAVDVKDRFGSYGLVGVVIFRVEGDALELDTFLLSCRVLGRGVEHRVLRWLGEEAQHRGLRFVRTRFEVTSKNKPAQQFLQSIGGSVPVHEFPAAQLRELRWSAATSVEAPKQKPKPAAADGRLVVDYAAIANELATPSQILEAMRRDSQSLRIQNASDGMTETERKLAAIWSDLLERPAVAVADNFFDLGGHSLLAVLLILRVRETFGVELPIDDVYSATLTLGELARRIEAWQLNQIDPAEYEALLAEIEALSDEEVQALLAKEGQDAEQA